MSFVREILHGEFSPLNLLRVISAHHGLVLTLTKREAWGRYRSTLLGALWPILTPLILLVVYGFVFGVIFRAKWPMSGSHQRLTDHPQLDYAMVLFCGLLVFQIFAETVSRSPSQLISNPNLVKKVVFPLEILSVSTVISAVIHAGIACLILVTVKFAMTGSLSPTLWLLPVTLLPIALLSLAFGWLVSSLGVYFRDLGQIVGLIVTGLMFISPIFFPPSAIPKNFSVLVEFNPLSIPIEATRQVVLFGELPHLNDVYFSICLGGATAIIGYIWFQIVRRGFSDVL